MIIEELSICKICNKPQKSNISMGTHLKLAHNMSIKQYIETFIEFPTCPICKNNKRKLSSRPILQYHRSNSLFTESCSDTVCISMCNTLRQKEYWKNNEKAKEKARNQRIEYLKNRLGKTAWERRSAGEMSYLEQWFYDNVIIKHNLCNKYDIVNEFCEYPYFVDFAFINIKLAVELDGKCHFVNGETRLEHDKKRDLYLINKGWKIFRIKYNETTDDLITEFLEHLAKFEVQDKKFIENRLYKYCELPKRIKRDRTKYFKELSIINLEKNKPLIKLVESSSIDFSKFGWVGQVALLLNKSPQKINGWMKKYMPDFYNRYCFKRIIKK